MLWESKVELGWDFFQEIIRHPVPLDMNILKALKRSSLGIDLYLWVTYRAFALKRPLPLSWRQLYRQFGVEPAKVNDRITVDNFRRKVLRELKKIKLAWPGLNYATGRGVLILYPFGARNSAGAAASARRTAARGSFPAQESLLAAVSGPWGFLRGSLSTGFCNSGKFSSTKRDDSRQKNFYQTGRHLADSLYQTGRHTSSKTSS